MPAPLSLDLRHHILDAYQIRQAPRKRSQSSLPLAAPVSPGFATFQKQGHVLPKKGPKHKPQAHHLSLCLLAYLMGEFDRQGEAMSWCKHM